MKTILLAAALLLSGAASAQNVRMMQTPVTAEYPPLSGQDGNKKVLRWSYLTSGRISCSVKWELPEERAQKYASREKITFSTADTTRRLVAQDHARAPGGWLWVWVAHPKADFVNLENIVVVVIGPDQRELVRGGGYWKPADRSVSGSFVNEFTLPLPSTPTDGTNVWVIDISGNERHNFEMRR